MKSLRSIRICEDDFDTESILDDEIEEGVIDNIMGATTDATATATHRLDSWYGHPMGMRKGVRPLRNAGDEGSWWCSPAVHVLELNKLSSPPAAADKKKRRSSVAGQPLLLKLNYDEVAKAWSDRGFPFPEELKEPGNSVLINGPESRVVFSGSPIPAQAAKYEKKI